MPGSGGKTIAVLGGGVTGLTSAFTLARSLPQDAYRIVLIESHSRLGGHVHSEREPSTSALYEWGPRSIRPVGYKGLRTVELLHQLSIQDRMVLVPRSSASAQNRFLYHGGQLLRLPSSLWSAILATLRQPTLRKIFAEVQNEWRVPRSDHLGTAAGDESVHAFFSRRFGPYTADTLASAMMHGIYAGDSRELSIKAVMPFLVMTEYTHGSLLQALLPRFLNTQYKAPTHKNSDKAKQEAIKSRLDPAIVQQLRSTSIYSFPQGLAELTRALEEELLTMPHVSIWKGDACKRIVPGRRIELDTMYSKLYADRVVATIPSRSLACLLPDLPHLAYNPSAHLAVVDIVLGAEDILPIRGFGYLVPRNHTNNSDEILGVIFDSDAVSNQPQRLTKLTVMLGGPYWRHRTSFPSEDDVKERALRALHSQLGLSLLTLTTRVENIRARVLTDTIPQYLVGHSQRMAELHAAVTMHPQWRNRLSLLGFSYGGVGVNDCVANAMDTCDAICKYEQQRSPLSDTTGLQPALFPV
mgnify:CR=1 FL=1